MAFAAPAGTDADHNHTPQEAEGMVGAMAFAVPAGTEADHINSNDNDNDNQPPAEVPDGDGHEVLRLRGGGESSSEEKCESSEEEEDG